MAIESVDELVPSPAVEGESPREKISYTPLAVLTIVFGTLVIASSLLFGFSEQKKYNPEVNSELRVVVSLTAPQFLKFTQSNVCLGSGELAGLSNAQVIIRGSNWLRKISLGQGTLNSEGGCIYSSRFSPPSDFYGGEVRANIAFSFGETDDFFINVGDSAPFKAIDLKINLG